MKRWPSYCCQLCGEHVGWLGRLLEAIGGPLHYCRGRAPEIVERYVALLGQVAAHNAACEAGCATLRTSDGYAGLCKAHRACGRDCPDCPRRRRIAVAGGAP